MGSPAACRSHRPSSLTCADGFVQMPACSGRAGCHVCGSHSAVSVPYCMRDEVPEHMLRGNGLPLFRQLEANDA